MSYRTAIRCENCREIIGHYGKLTIYYGSPLRECPFCGEPYLDRSYVELAIYDPKFLEKMPVSVVGLVIMAIATLLGVVLLTLGQVYGLLGLALAAGILFISLAMYPAKKRRLKAERERSERRLSEPDYAWRLKNIGYSVPIYYLESEKYNALSEAEAAEKNECAICGTHLREDQFKHYKGILCCNGCYNTLKKHE